MSSTSQKSPRFLTTEIVEDLNKQQEEGKAQLKQLVDSGALASACLLYTSPSPRDVCSSRMPSSA